MPPKTISTEPSPEISCSQAECSFVTPAGAPTWEIALGFLTQHTTAVHSPPPPPPTNGGSSAGHTPHMSKLEKLPRPNFELAMSEGQWEFLSHQWRAYIGQTTVTEAQHLQQLQAACSPDLLQRIFDMGNYSTLTTPKLFMESMEKIAVIKVHKAIHTMNMWKMTQNSDESIRAFAARITGTADLCGMTVTCTCGEENSFRDKVVMQVLLHGMRENDIRSKVLSRNTTGELLELHQAVDYIEAEEAGLIEASDLHEHSSIHALRRSGYMKGKDHVKKKKCRNCGGPRHGQHNTLADREAHCKAYGKTCSRCGKLHHYSSVCRSSTEQKDKVENDKKTELAPLTAAGFFPVSAVSPNTSSQASRTRRIRHSTPKPPPSTQPTVLLPSHDNLTSTEESTLTLMSAITLLLQSALLAIKNKEEPVTPTGFGDLRTILATLQHNHHSQGPITTIPIPHHVHDIISGWHATKPANSPTTPLQICLDRKAYTELSVPIPRMHHNRSKPGRCDNKQCVLDTGAQLTVVPISLLHSLGIKEESIFPVSTRVNGASSPITVSGGILLTFSGKSHRTGLTYKTRQLAYVSSSVDQIYLSKSACADLGTIPSSFPELGACTTTPHPRYRT